MRIWKQRKEQVPALPFIVSMSPPGYPLAWLRPRRARFRFARQDHCSSTTSIRLNFRLAHDPDGIIYIQTEELCVKTAVGSFLDSFTHGGGHYRS